MSLARRRVVALKQQLDQSIHAPPQRPRKGMGDIDLRESAGADQVARVAPDAQRDISSRQAPCGLGHSDNQLKAGASLFVEKHRAEAT